MICDTILLHHKNFHHPAHLTLPEKIYNSYQDMPTATLTTKLIATIPMCGMAWCKLLQKYFAANACLNLFKNTSAWKEQFEPIISVVQEAFFINLIV